MHITPLAGLNNYPPRCGGLDSTALAGRRTSRLTPTCIFLVVGLPTTQPLRREAFTQRLPTFCWQTFGGET
ncbi:MAG: hypothetical protein LBU34_04700 [Planctomycetaceae bacterium]|nr:hypothetical protein [Planctomycetaceae bacterium]